MTLPWGIMWVGYVGALGACVGWLAGLYDNLLEQTPGSSV